MTLQELQEAQSRSHEEIATLCENAAHILRDPYKAPEQSLQALAALQSPIFQYFVRNQALSVLENQ